MMNPRLLSFCILIALFASAQAQLPKTRYQLSNGNETPSYAEAISWWKQADKLSPALKLITVGNTDSGEPLHLAIYSPTRDFDFTSIERKKAVKILINNGIHPGEPDGIDASILLVADLIAGKKKVPDNVVLAFIPVYNIGGALNRSPFYRVDQNGPDSFGFRGNAQNLDLNRDFIKSDSRNARSFAKIFHLVDPHIFIDNHSTNGADYQHVMTLISSQHDKLGGEMGDFMNRVFEPGLYKKMQNKGYDLVPYVNIFGNTPEKGWNEFLEGPRYSTGYAALFQCFGFVPETHMLKPYTQRVDATYALMECFIAFAKENAAAIRELKNNTRASVKKQAEFPIDWELNRDKFISIPFKGYTAGYKPSAISGQPRLYYDRTKPFTMQVPFYNNYVPRKKVKTPSAYIIPQGWWAVTELLSLNNVKMHRLSKDTVIEVETYRIENHSSSPRAIEKHHINSVIEMTTRIIRKAFRKGDWFIPMDQTANRFLVETLEPDAPDSYFTWNFFDAILMQKEGFSAYSFEDTAAEWLKSNPQVAEALERKRKTDTSFAGNGSAQLDFIFKNSPFYEPDHLQYPVFRVLK